jgi:hypothetical protein
MHCVLPGWKKLGGKRGDDYAADYRFFENFCISGLMFSMASSLKLPGLVSLSLERLNTIFFIACVEIFY